MAIPTIQLTGKVLGPDGVAPTAGTITVVLSDPGTVMDGGTAQFVSGRSVWTLAGDGSLPAAADLVPNDAITRPGATAAGGTYYTAHYDLTVGGKRTRFEEEWVVASAPSSLDIGDVTRTVTPGTVPVGVDVAALLASKLDTDGNGSAVRITATGSLTARTMADHLHTLPDAQIAPTGTPAAMAQGLADWFAQAPMGSTWKLRRTLTQIAKIATAPPAQLRVLRGGDSVSQHIIDRTITKLTTALGGVGFMSVLGTSNYVSLWQSVTGDVVLQTYNFDFTKFATGSYADVGVGGTIRLGSGGAGVYCDEIKLLYTVEPGAGTFQVETETGGAYTVRTASQSAAGALSTGVLTYTQTAGIYSLRVTGLTGRVKLTGVSFRVTTASGVFPVYLTTGGWQIAVDGVTLTPGLIQTPDAIMQPWMDVAAPDLFLWESKEFPTAWDQWDRIPGWARTAQPLCDIVGIGSTPVATNDPDQILANAALRAKVRARGGLYWDAYVPEGSYSTAVAHGWMDGVDLVHQTALGHEVQSSLFWAELFGGIGNMPDPRPVKTDLINTREIDLRPGAASTSLDGKLRSVTPDVLLETARSIQAAPTSSPTSVFLLLAPSDLAYGYQYNTVPMFRSQGRTGAGAQIYGPWVRASASGTTLIAGANGGTVDALAPFGASEILVGALTGAGIYSGSGSPEGVVTANVGSIYMRTDGAAGTSHYVKESGAGNTGWVAK